MSKEAIYLKIDKELLRRFRQYVLAKHGRFHGFFAMEIENALRRYLEEEGGSAQNTQNINPTYVKRHARLDRIIGWLNERGYVRQFSWKDWEQAVISTVGSDPRTIRKYLELAMKLGRIRHVVGNVWEFTG